MSRPSPRRRWRLPHPWRGRHLSVGARILISMVLLALLTLLVAGTTSYAVQREQVASRVDATLTRSAQEFRRLAEVGGDPETGEPFTTAERLIYISMQRTQPAPNEGLLALTSDRVRWQAAASVPLRLEDDRELVADLLAAGPPDAIVLHNHTTAATTYRMVLIPVRLADDAEPMLYVLAYDMDAEFSELNSTYAVFFAAGLGSLLLSALLGWVLVARLLRPLRQMRRTAESITEHDLDERLSVEGTDDLSDLSRTFNNMLDRLQLALGSQRQLLDDVGHELRTPITIVQGHLELQDSHDPEDVTQTRTIALDELDRMGLLVEDLVTLAKSDRADFVVRRPVDLGLLLEDTLGKASALGDRDWVVDECAHGTADLDPRRIAQALLQLCQNAVKFSPPGSTVGLGCSADTEGVRIWVRDQGVGVAPDDQATIFNRFDRGRNGRRAEGSGLGLAIVQAIASAHGGTAGVDSTPGVGSVFYLDLPRHAGPRPNPGGADEPNPDH